MKPDLVWSAALGELQLQMTQATFDTWLRDSRFLGFDNDTFTIGVKSGYAKEWLDNRLLTAIKRTMARLTGRTVVVEFVVYEGEERQEAQVIEIDVADPEESPSNERPAETALREESGGLTIEAEYGEARAEIIQPDRGVFVTGYTIENFIHRLGPGPYCMVQMLRLMASGEKHKDGTRSVESSAEELAAKLGMGKTTIERYLRAEPIPDERGWLRIRPVNDEARALALFIPRMALIYRKGRKGPAGRLIRIRMDDPLTPEDEGRVEHMVVDRIKGREPRSPEEEIRAMVESIDLSIQDLRVQNSRLRPIAEKTAVLLHDEHSMRMFLQVLQKLLKAKRLDLFLTALDAGLEALASPTGWKPGIAFVETMKELAAEEGLKVYAEKD